MKSVFPFSGILFVIPIFIAIDASGQLERARSLDLLTRAPLDTNAPPRWRAVDVDTKIEIGYGIAVADIDGDKKPDIVLADKNQIVWYRNPNWEKHVIAEKLTPLDHVCIAVADINGDGKAEIAAGAGWNPSDTVNSGAVFYLIPPADRTQKWEPVQLPHEPTVHRMRWVRDEAGKLNLVVVPLHGRGNKSGQGEGVKVLAYHMPLDPGQPWSTELIDSSLHMTHNFNPVQWDNDPADEILLASKEGVYLLSTSHGRWTRKELVGTNTPGFEGAGEVRNGKLPGGKRFIATVEPMHGTKLVVYIEPSGGVKAWQRHVLDDSLIEGHALACGDLLNAGFDQVVVGWRGKAPADKVGIKMFIPFNLASLIEGAPLVNGDHWKVSVVDDNTMACEDLCLADLNGDGRLDIIASGRATKNVKIYFNEKPL